MPCWPETHGDPCEHPEHCGICDDCDEWSHSDDNNALTPLVLTPGDTRYLCKGCLQARLDGPSAADLDDYMSDLAGKMAREG